VHTLMALVPILLLLLLELLSRCHTWPLKAEHHAEHHVTGASS